MNVELSSPVNLNRMVELVSHYEQGQISSCIVLLMKMCGSNVNHFDSLLARNNLAVCQYQQSFIINDIKHRKSAWENLLSVWSTVSCMPLSRAVNRLTLVSACNILYCAVAGEDNTVHYNKASEISFLALEKFAARHGIISCSRIGLPREKFMFLLQNLIRCKMLDKIEAHIILYMCVLIFLGDESNDVICIMEEILRNCNNTYESEKENYFLTSPSEMKLVTGRQDCFQIISELASLLCFICSCNNTQWCSNSSIRKIEHSRLKGLFQFIKSYAEIQFKEGNCGQLDLVPTEKELSFAVNLLEAVKFSSEKQHSVAIKLCSLVVNGTIGHTKLCSLPLMYTALQFQLLGEREFQIQTLKVAEDSLLHCPAAQCSFHVQPVALLVGKLNLLQIPTLSMIQYHLGRALLENQEYEKAAIEYQKLQNISYRMEWRPNICNFPVPHSSVVGHEHVLSLLLSRQFDMALELIPSLEQDFLILFLHAEIVASKQQLNQSIQLLNRAICQIACCSFLTEKVRNVLTAKLNWRLSQMFHKCANTKDSFFQLKMAIELCPFDSKLIEYSINYAKCLGISVNLTQIPTEETEMRDTIPTLLSVQNDLSLKYLIEICDFESLSSI